MRMLVGAILILAGTFAMCVSLWMAEANRGPASGVPPFIPGLLGVLELGAGAKFVFGRHVEAQK